MLSNYPFYHTACYLFYLLWQTSPRLLCPMQENRHNRRFCARVSRLDKSVRISKLDQFQCRLHCVNIYSALGHRFLSTLVVTYSIKSNSVRVQTKVSNLFLIFRLILSFPCFLFCVKFRFSRLSGQLLYRLYRVSQLAYYTRTIKKLSRQAKFYLIIRLIVINSYPKLAVI